MKYHILLVEDKAELREMLTTALARMGYEVVPAPDAPPAITLLASRHFSAVLTDLRLPTGSGMDVLRAALDNDATLPVVLMTACNSPELTESALALGVYGVVDKPFEMAAIEMLLIAASRSGDRAMDAHEEKFAADP